jgi:hypothetical protein
MAWSLAHERRRRSSRCSGRDPDSQCLPLRALMGWRRRKRRLCRPGGYRSPPASLRRFRGVWGQTPVRALHDRASTVEGTRVPSLRAASIRAGGGVLRIDRDEAYDVPADLCVNCASADLGPRRSRGRPSSMRLASIKDPRPPRDNSNRAL